MSFCGHEDCAEGIQKIAKSMLAACDNDPDQFDGLLAETSFNFMRDMFGRGHKMNRAEWHKFMNYWWTIRDFMVHEYMQQKRKEK